MDPNIAQKIQDMSAGWRNFLVGQMGVEPGNFQLAQGCLGLQTSDNYGLFKMADAVPPASAVGYYDAGSNNSRSSAYGMLLTALLDEISPTALQTALGNSYTDWLTYMASHPLTDGQTALDRFKRWAEGNLDPGRASNAVGVFRSAVDSPWNKAQEDYGRRDINTQTFKRVGQPDQSLYLYTATTDEATSAINRGKGFDVDFDTNTMETAVSSTFARGSASGFFRLFSGGGDGSFAQVDARSAGSRWTIRGRVGRFATIGAQPAGSWYSSAEVKRALGGRNDNSIWNPDSRVGDWSTFFGQSDGSLARYVSQIMLISDYELTVTSHAQYTQAEFEQVRSSASFGVWPFFSAGGSATHSTACALNSDGTLRMTHTLNKGVIQIWGVTVQDQR